MAVGKKLRCRVFPQICEFPCFGSQKPHSCELNKSAEKIFPMYGRGVRVFGIIGKPFKIAREWCLFHAEILKNISSCPSFKSGSFQVYLAIFLINCIELLSLSYPYTNYTTVHITGLVNRLKSHICAFRCFLWNPNHTREF